MAENDNKFTLKVITPDRVFYEEEVSMVEFNTVEGEVGIYKQHIPMTMIIAPGILTITQENETKEAALHAGFVEVLQDKVTILAEIIEWPVEIDLKRAEESKERAENRIKEHAPGTDMRRAEMSLKRAVARINAINYK
ncbi:MAG: ATP synthase F1 subunit epsilon [Bacillus sp. (in: Bacteria)]|nr:ATP synthase F1 subunit epsilon [Bacillus sp. (in: firmicutes)]MCM1425292.1 ATP synthase F1 subunit epsilon [Eubacterium sp.]